MCGTVRAVRILAAVLALVVLLQAAAVALPLACDADCGEKGRTSLDGQTAGDAPDDSCTSCLCCSAARHPGMVPIADLPGPPRMTTFPAPASSPRFFQPDFDILHVPRPSRA